MHQYLPGQSPLLQFCVSARSSFGTPSQFLSHVLVLVCSPDPHVTLQLDHSLQRENTEKKLNVESYTYTSINMFADNV